MYITRMFKRILFIVFTGTYAPVYSMFQMRFHIAVLKILIPLLSAGSNRNFNSC
ncbi:hypothetical protein CHU_1722 [Cytophaga hutchinsonii ATCC 33406]|uniref:Uncharacterized protein n=1 Tax=Cytophaga hutchinsonii (strain ATCC 33406 / DSM 1761 / CIP 103989 / NBRC 15051 / NCIMB 9469 / D465) TaxID=269798 RepID=A0A6N4SRQ0_CYTH3|nr:hypothetical protein CHU_1722 [Cytophaga hutchinsonii ATCC 33406]